MCLDSLSTTTRVVLYPLNSGSSPMVSTEITSQWRVGIRFGVSFPTFCTHQEGLAVVAGVTPCHIAGNIAGDAQPPVIVGDQLQCLPPPWVTSHHGVMVGMDNVMVELGVFWDIHASPVHDQVSISLPLIQSKHACSKLSEGFDYCIVVVCTSLDAFYQLVASAIH